MITADNEATSTLRER